MRNLFLSAIASLALFSCSQDDINDDQTALNDVTLSQPKSLNKEVKLIKAWKSESFYRGSESYINKFTVRVANLGADKKVSIYHERLDGNWDEIPLSYELQIDENSEIWSGSYGQSGFDISKVYADEFVVRYEVAGEVYWDNNNEKNYKMSKEDGYFFADENLNISLDQDFTSFAYQPAFDANDLRVHVDVKNIPGDKEVEVVYTTDGWNTQKSFALDYAQTITSGPLVNIFTPNSYGVERWRGTIGFDTSVENVEFAIVYRVNGQVVAWDNNYGKNYVETIKRF